MLSGSFLPLMELRGWERPLDGTRPQVGVECSKGDVEIRRSEKNARRAVVAINVAGFLDIPA